MFRLDKKRWVYWFAFISIFLISGSVLAASWYSTLSQSFVSTGSASTVHTFTLPSNQKVASDGYIKIELTGDFDAADEYADLYIEGTYISKVTGGAATCSTNLTKKFMLSQSNLEKWGADGKIVVTVKNSSAVSGCTSTQRKHGLALSVTNLVSSQPVKTLSKVRINCTTPIVEGLTGTCSAFADFSDNSTQTVTSSITNWKADRAASISTSGVITALPVSADTFVTITGNYTYNGVTMTGIGSTTVKDDSISGLREFRISCPTSFNENTSIQCRSYAKIDGAEREVTTSSTWSENASYTSITPTGGLLTAVDVIGDSGVFVKASYSYGGVTKAAEQVVTVKDVPILPTALTITCPSSIDESSTANCTAKVTLSNNTTSDVTSSSQWASSSAFATVDTNGKITTQAVTADQHININASYTASSVTKTATFPLIIKKKTSPSSAVSFTNSSNNQSLTFNGNSAWTLSPDTIYGTGGYKICESSRPTYCLNAEAGFLQSSPVQPGWLSMVFVLQDMGNGYVSMRSAHTGHYIYLNGSNIVTGNIDNTLPFAQWKKIDKAEVFNQIRIINQLDNYSLLNFNNNSFWVLLEDNIYNTGGYKICESTRSNYCLNIENGFLQSTEIQSGWLSAVWIFEDAGGNFNYIKNGLNQNQYIYLKDNISLLGYKNYDINLFKWFVSNKRDDSIHSFNGYIETLATLDSTDIKLPENYFSSFLKRDFSYLDFHRDSQQQTFTIEFPKEAVNIANNTLANCGTLINLKNCMYWSEQKNIVGIEIMTQAYDYLTLKTLETANIEDKKIINEHRKKYIYERGDINEITDSIQYQTNILDKNRINIEWLDVFHYRAEFTQKIFDRNTDEISNAAKKWNINQALIKAIIREEVAHMRPGEGVGEYYFDMGGHIGIGGMTVGVFGTREQLLDEKYSINAIAKHLAEIRDNLEERLLSLDVYNIAVIYNCGEECLVNKDGLYSVQPVNAYPERVVRFYKSYLN